MKTSGILVLGILLLMTLILTGCNSNKLTPEEEAILNDTIPPIIQIQSTERHVTIRQGEEFDLLRGVRGIDNLEGIITDRIQMNKGNYDPNVPGTYEILYFLSDRAGNAAEVVVRTITVLNTAIFPAPPVYLGTIPNEAPKPNVPACFLGAWYNKVFSSKDRWMGIEGVVTLPEMKIERYDGNYDPNLALNPNFRNLDNPSIYIGGFATTESDVGLSLSRVCLGENCTLSTGGLAFRPFWRYITNRDFDEGGYASNRDYAVSCRDQGTSGFKNCIANWHFRDTQYYYLPGDKLRILIYSPEPNFLQLQIEVIEKSTLPDQVRLREENGWKDPENFISPKFRSPGHGTGGITEYKRVNAIDQAGNEGKPIIETTSFVDTAIWHETYLYREINGELHRVPLTRERAGVMQCPISDRFTSTFDGVDAHLGGEKIRIHPAGPIVEANAEVNVIIERKREDDL